MKNKGFTLIELVVVIVLLGILAVTAAPKFLNLQVDARVSALNGAKGALTGANGIVYGKAAIAGKESGSSDITISGKSVSLIDGMPVAQESNLANVWDTDLFGYDAPQGKAVVYALTEGTYESVIKGECYVQAENETVSSIEGEAMGKQIELSVVDTGC